MTVKSFHLYFQSLLVVCIGFVAACVLFCAIIISVSAPAHTAIASPQQAHILIILAPCFAVACVLAGSLLYKKRLAKIKGLPTLDEKLTAYKFAVITRFILLDGPAIFAGISYFMCGEKYLFIITAVMLLIMLYLLPKKGRLMKELAFTKQQVDIITGSKA